MSTKPRIHECQDIDSFNIDKMLDDPSAVLKMEANSPEPM